MALRELTVISFVAMAAISTAGPAWTSNSYDVYGYSSIAKATLAPDVSRALKLVDSDARSAYREFSRLYDGNTNDPTVYYGLMLSARKCDQIFDAIEKVAKDFGADRKTKLKASDSRIIKVENRFAIAFSLGLAMAYSSDIPGGDIRYMERLRPLSKVWYGTLAMAEPTVEAMTPVEAFIVGSTGLMQGREAMVRRVLRPVSERHPNDVALHMLLCRAYSQGTYSLTRGNKPIPVPEDEKSKPELALTEAISAVRLNPDHLDANYYAGILLSSTNPPEAKKYWKKFLALLPSNASDRRREYVLKWLKAH